MTDVNSISVPMHDHLRCTRYASRRSERGQALLILLVVLGLATGMFVYSMVSNVSRTNASNNTNALALAEAKAALIGWAVSRGDGGLDYTGSNYRPGELPCPDTNNDGFDNDGNCSAGQVGRLPWKTLGIPQLKDDSGETLWYAVAGSFRRYNASTTPITSNTVGNMTVYTGSTATTVTTQAIAIIFAPGPILYDIGQLRDTTANQTTASNYLESTGGANNATTNGPFIMASESTTFNDRILVMTAVDLIPFVEQRVAREMMSILQSYRTATGGDYPWADLGDGGSNDASIGGYSRSRFPCGTAKPTDWGDSGTPLLPRWLQNGCGSITGWNSAIYYAVAKNKLENDGSGCGTCSGASSLTVSNSGSYMGDLCLRSSSPFQCTSTVISSGSADLVLITPGAATSSSRGSWSTSTLNTTITGYFDDSDNRDNNDESFVVPTASSSLTAPVYDRDRIYIVR